MEMHKKEAKPVQLSSDCTKDLSCIESQLISFLLSGICPLPNADTPILAFSFLMLCRLFKS